MFMISRRISERRGGGKKRLQRFLRPHFAGVKKWNAQWLAEKVSEMIECMNSEEIPESIIACKNCAYARQMINIK